MNIKGLPAGFVIPARLVLASKPPSGTDWVHEIKHDGYRLIVYRDGSLVRLYSRNAYDWTARLAAIEWHMVCSGGRLSSPPTQRARFLGRVGAHLAEDRPSILVLILVRAIAW
jgi:hypothetical protein